MVLAALCLHLGAVVLPAQEPPSATEVIAPASHRELNQLFSAYEYDWDTLGNGVPPIVLATLPVDLEHIAESSRRKKTFFLSLLPMVLLVNEEIGQQRQFLLDVFERNAVGEPFSAQENQLVGELAREYDIQADPLTDENARRRLLRRVDILPPSLVLAQAANETGYGTSRFALQGNNLFGEWTFTPGTGIVPLNRPAGASYEVRRFPSLFDSVRSYMKNINTHRAYREFRKLRADFRSEGLPLRGQDLAAGLENYSERREAYVREIREIIRGNRLSLLSTVTLRQSQSPERTYHGLFSTGARASRPSPSADPK